MNKLNNTSTVLDILIQKRSEQSAENTKDIPAQTKVTPFSIDALFGPETMKKIAQLRKDNVNVQVKSIVKEGVKFIKVSFADKEKLDLYAQMFTQQGQT